MRTLQTPRLTLRPVAPADVDALFAIQGDRNHMRHTHCPASRAECAAWLQAYTDHEPVAGFAPWTVVHRRDGEVIGWGGLNVDPLAPVWGPEVSYFVHPARQGSGLATELVRAALWYAFAEARLAAVGAFARAGNTGSVRVLQKCGFECRGFEQALGRDHYEITGHRWARRPQGPRPAGLAPADRGGQA